MRKVIAGFQIFLFAAMLAFLVGCNGDKVSEAAEQTKPQAPALPVEVLKIKATPYRQVIELPGRISAVRDAEVRARVAGILLSRDFEEGAYVKKGQVLFHIDPAPLQSALAKAKASLAKAEASMVDYEATMNRYRPLLKSGVISQQDYDTAAANYKVAKAEKEAAIAAVKTAALDLSYATVEAPISGKIGKALVTEGSLVGKNEATSLAKIRQLDPIYADLNQPVAEYLKVRTAMNKSKASGQEPEVSVHIENMDYTEKGRLLFSDASVDERTGQVSLRCEFPNKDDMLLPGMFVRILIRLASQGEAVFVPQRAVSMSQTGGSTVYVVDAQSTARIRQVKTGEMQDNLWQITEGLQPDDLVVVNGQGRLKPGMKVVPTQDADGAISAQN